MRDRLLIRPPTPRRPLLVYPPDEDGRLIVAAQTDPQEFAPLYARYVDPIHRYCLRCLGDREEAADATQEVFARALRALPRYRDRAFRPWLFAIAHNVIVDGCRARAARPLEESLEQAAWSADPAPGPEEAALAADTSRSLRACLARLAPDQRAVVELRLADLTGREIADVLSRSLGSVKIAQHRGFRRLAILLGVAETEGRDGER